MVKDGPSHLVMSSVAFSPTFMVITPSSQPICNLVSKIYSKAKRHDPVSKATRTFDNLANADFGHKVATANGGVEPNGRGL